jgi:hypothetical protein
MSRYDIVDMHSAYHCIVGFDPPLGTFITQVYRQDHSDLLLWCTGSARIFRTSPPSKR